MAVPKQTSEVDSVSPAPMTTEQATDLSWKFIDVTAEKVAKMPQALQDEIKNSGLRLADAGAEYVHVVDMQQINAQQQKDKSKSKSLPSKR
jgi:hypothetical protein